MGDPCEGDAWTVLSAHVFKASLVHRFLTRSSQICDDGEEIARKREEGAHLHGSIRAGRRCGGHGMDPRHPNLNNPSLEVGKAEGLHAFRFILRLSLGVVLLSS